MTSGELEQFKILYPEVWQTITLNWIPGFAERLLNRYDWNADEYNVEGALDRDMDLLVTYVTNIQTEEADPVDPDELFELAAELYVSLGRLIPAEAQAFLPAVFAETQVRAVAEIKRGSAPHTR